MMNLVLQTSVKFEKTGLKRLKYKCTFIYYKNDVRLEASNYGETKLKAQFAAFEEILFSDDIKVGA